MDSPEGASAGVDRPATARRPRTAAVPPYARVKQHLKQGLAAGRWPPGALMPSEAELVAEFGVSRMTVNRALRELQAEGLVERSQGVGTFAAPLHRVVAVMRRLGGTPSPTSATSPRSNRRTRRRRWQPGCPGCSRARGGWR